MNGERTRAQARKRGTGVGNGVDPDPEPGHAIAARNADEAEQQDDGHSRPLVLQEQAEVDRDDAADEHLEQEDEPALGDEVRPAGAADQLRDGQHRLVCRQAPDAHVSDQSEQEAREAHAEAGEQECASVEAGHVHRPEIGQDERGLASAGPGRRGGGRRCLRGEREDQELDVRRQRAVQGVGGRRRHGHAHAHHVTIRAPKNRPEVLPAAGGGPSPPDPSTRQLGNLAAGHLERLSPGEPDAIARRDRNHLFDRRWNDGRHFHDTGLRRLNRTLDDGRRRRERALLPHRRQPVTVLAHLGEQQPRPRDVERRDGVRIEGGPPEHQGQIRHRRIQDEIEDGHVGQFEPPFEQRDLGLEGGGLAGVRGSILGVDVDGQRRQRQRPHNWRLHCWSEPGDLSHEPRSSARGRHPTCPR